MRKAAIVLLLAFFVAPILCAQAKDSSIVTITPPQCVWRAPPGSPHPDITRKWVPNRRYAQNGHLCPAAASMSDSASGLLSVAELSGRPSNVQSADKPNELRPQ